MKSAEIMKALGDALESHINRKASTRGHEAIRGIVHTPGLKLSSEQRAEIMAEVTKEIAERTIAQIFEAITKEEKK